ncbi:hypothetical protein TCE0_017r04509 [Talaromyces pinophilus]|uniref:GPI inositol-deacylase winged helix domain-containing protein n=1 Tax=Talaromyces pinophilus TaxID=128442 RepID=A0A6V8H3F6_TALPI|nr:hypothetical protein TCE0_017r04509 [Talaromyces pinophilus]
MYDDGPDALRLRKLESLKKAGMVSENAVPHPVVANTTEWEAMTEEEKKMSSKAMEIFEGMVDGIDQAVGKLVDYLWRIGELYNTIQSWDLARMHVFITSRNEPDIRQYVQAKSGERINLMEDKNELDVNNYINSQLMSDELKPWEKHHDTIRDGLAKRAKGIFRWLECQLRDLKTVPRSEAKLDQWLHDLPLDLTESYDRMLNKISPLLIEDARRIFSLLCFSERPLTVAEVKDAFAVNLEKQCLDRQARLEDVESLYEICPGLLQITSSDDELRYNHSENSTVNLAHASVREYLLSQQATRQQKIPPSLVLKSSVAHCEISQICLIYLMDHELSTHGLNETLMRGLPFSQYAAWFWYFHYKSALKPTPGRLNDLVLKLFKDSPQAFLNWVRLYNIQTPRLHKPTLDLKLSDVPSPIHYACFLGLPDILQKLIEDVGKKGETAIMHLNKSHGKHGPAILAASKKGHISILEILISYKVDLNVPCGREEFEEGTPLSAAAHWGHCKVVELLLDMGADPNLQVGSTPTALQISSAFGYEEIVQLLIRKGGNVNANTPGRYGTALHAACMAGNLNIVQILIKEGADPTAKGGTYRTLLQAASRGGNAEIVSRFLNVEASHDPKADCGIEDPDIESALKISITGGRVSVAKLLCIAGKKMNSDSILSVLMTAFGMNLRTLAETQKKGHSLYTLTEKTKTCRLSLVLLMDHYGDQPPVITKMIAMAVSLNEGITKEIISLLAKRHDVDIDMVRDIISGREYGEMITNWFLSQYEDQTCARPYSKQTEEILELLHAQKETNIKIRDEAMDIAKAASDDLQKKLVDNEGCPLRPLEIIKVIASSSEGGMKSLQMVLALRPSWIDIAQVAIVAASNPGCGKEILEMLLKSPSNGIDIAQVALVAASNPGCGKEILRKLLCVAPNQIDVYQIACMVEDKLCYGREMVDMLVGFAHKQIVKILTGNECSSKNENDISQASGKKERGEINVVELTKVLARFSESLPGGLANFWDLFLREYPLRVTEDILIAAANNYRKGEVILNYLLAHREPIVEVEESVFEVAWRNRYKGEQIIRFLWSKPLKTEQVPSPFIEKVSQELAVMAKVSQGLGVMAIQSILLATKDKSSVVKTIIPIATESKEGSLWIETLLKNARESTLAVLDEMSDKELVFYISKLGSTKFMRLITERRGTGAFEKFINASDEFRRTPYYFAILRHHIEMARLLRNEYGARLK